MAGSRVPAFSPAARRFEREKKRKRKRRRGRGRGRGRGRESTTKSYGM